MLLPPAAAGESGATTEDSSGAIAVFGGVMTNSDAVDFLTPWTLDLRESNMVALAATYGIGRFDHRFGFEIEGQIMRHFGDQDHWEITLPIIGRWEAFPWDDVVDTSLAIGAGPSYASEKPKVEVANEGDSRRLLLYWMMELELGPPGKDWSALIRLHHRSTVYGLIGDAGGSNAVLVGLRQRF